MRLMFRQSASLLTLAFFAILGAGSFDTKDFIIWGIWGIAPIIVFFVAMLILVNHSLNKEHKRVEAQRQARLEQERKDKEEFETWYKDYKDEYGVPDKIIITQENSKDGVIYVHENACKLFILGRHYNFKEILSCTFTDDPTVIKGAVTAVTKSENGSTIGRAIVGNVIAGPAGAIIGGTTGKKFTEFKQENDQTIHDYTVLINVNSIENPLLRINTGSNGQLTNEIVGLMNVIISRK